MLEVNNEGTVEKQVNTTGSVYLTNTSRLHSFFERLNQEISKSEKIDEIRNELKRYITDKDGLGLEKKLQDGGFTEKEIFRALERKQMFWKKAETYILYPSAQRIYSDLLSKIMIDFEAYIEPLINNNENKELIVQRISEHIINPLYSLINNEGAKDEVLCFSMEEIYGMIYYLTGRCHINWTNYDTVSPSI